jgi:hypothetical protein
MVFGFGLNINKNQNITNLNFKTMKKTIFSIVIL